MMILPTMFCLAMQFYLVMRNDIFKPDHGRAVNWLIELKSEPLVEAVWGGPTLSEKLYLKNEVRLEHTPVTCKNSMRNCRLYINGNCMRKPKP